MMTTTVELLFMALRPTAIWTCVAGGRGHAVQARGQAGEDLLG